MDQKLGRYVLKRELGRGGMAIVYVAHDPMFERDVAVKVMPAQFLHDQTFFSRFEREAKAVAKLEHPAIVPVYDLGQDRGRPYLVMRYLTGGSLKDRMSRGPLPLSETVQIVERVSSALDEAHQNGMVHRDVKPANILFGRRGLAYLSDFGIVKLAESNTALTAGMIIGTPEYMSPEQVLGQQLDGRSDVYSLGIILYLMLTGQPPYAADTPMGLAYKHVNDPIPDIRQVRRGLPPGCEQVIQRALAKDRNQRFATAGMLSNALKAVVAGGAAAHPRTVPYGLSSPRTGSPSVTSPTPPTFTDQQDTELIGKVPESELPKSPAKKRRVPGWIWVAGGGAAFLLMILCISVAILVINEIGNREPTAQIFLAEASPEARETQVIAAVAEEEIAEVEAETQDDDPANISSSTTATSADGSATTGEKGPITLDLNWGDEPDTIDPALVTSEFSAAIAGNLFVTLTKLDPDTGEVLPYLATSWEDGVDAQGNQTWTFHLRDDIPWVTYDPPTGEVNREAPPDDRQDFVNADDVVYAVRRSIDPDTKSAYAYVLYPIKNALSINSGDEDVELDELGVEALDSRTVRFTMEEPAGYFPSIVTLLTTAPLPDWTIDRWEGQWTEAGLIVSSGPYVLEQWLHGSRLSLIKNPHWPEADQVQIERIDGIIVNDASTAMARYENGEIDTVVMPLSELDRVKNDPSLSDELRAVPDACTYYFGFTNNKYPFDDERVRRAFSQAIDRKTLVENVLKGGQIPATSFAPPGVFGAPEPAAVGLAYNPEAAKRSFTSFLQAEGLTVSEFNDLDIILMHNTSEGHARIAAAIVEMWNDVLGVEVNIESQDWAVYLSTLQLSTRLDEMPHIWRMGWCADYADENNWVYQVFHASAGANRLRRSCTDANCDQTSANEADELTTAALQEVDPDIRAELYWEAERILAEDEAAYAPIYYYGTFVLTKPWLKRTFPAFAPPDYASWTIVQEDKMAASGR